MRARIWTEGSVNGFEWRERRLPSELVASIRYLFRSKQEKWKALARGSKFVIKNNDLRRAPQQETQKPNMLAAGLEKA